MVITPCLRDPMEIEHCWLVSLFHSLRLHKPCLYKCFRPSYWDFQIPCCVGKSKDGWTRQVPSLSIRQSPAISEIQACQHHKESPVDRKIPPNSGENQGMCNRGVFEKDKTNDDKEDEDKEDDATAEQPRLLAQPPPLFPVFHLHLGVGGASPTPPTLL